MAPLTVRTAHNPRPTSRRASVARLGSGAAEPRLAQARYPDTMGLASQSKTTSIKLATGSKSPPVLLVDVARLAGAPAGSLIRGLDITYARFGDIDSSGRKLRCGRVIDHGYTDARPPDRCSSRANGGP